MSKASGLSDLHLSVAWFRREDWNEVKRISPDLPDTYEEWLAIAEKGVQDIEKAAQQQLVKIVLTPDELRNWQRSTGRKKINAAARAEITAELGRKRHKALMLLTNRSFKDRPR